MPRKLALLSVAFLLAAAMSAVGQEKIEPLVRVVDIDKDAPTQVKLHNGDIATIELLGVKVQRMAAGAIRAASVRVRVNGETTKLGVGNYNLPKTVAGVQIDCSIVHEYKKDSRSPFWGLDKEARFRLWPADSPLIRPGTFGYPVEQRFLSGNMHASNEPAGETPKHKFYYHAAIDFGGAETVDPVFAATDGLVVAARGKVLEDHADPVTTALNAKPRADVIYILDDRGWYYRYSHLHETDQGVKLGQRIKIGQRLGSIGKRGSSGGWAHLHFEIKRKQPPGKWGTANGFPYVWQAYLEKYDPSVIAVARPHYVVRPGETVTLDAEHSWAKNGIAEYEWQFDDGTTVTGKTAKRSYETPGVHDVPLKVVDKDGNVDYDFARVEVWAPLYGHSLGRGLPEWKVRIGRSAPGVHAAFYPTRNIQPGETVTFFVRARGTARGKDVWDFGDGSETATTQSNTNQDYHPPLNEGGYATVEHRFEKPGHYIVTVRRKSPVGEAIGRLHVPVGIEE